jgi:hypothetical protein
VKTDTCARSILALFLGLSLTSLPAQTNPPSDSGVRDAARTLIASGFEPASLDALRAYARDPQATPYLKSRSMAAYALAILSKGDTNLFERARLAHASAFPDDTALIPLRPADCVALCPACNGQREGRTVCTTCYGKGTILQLPKEKISAAFTAVLGEIIASVDREEALMQNIAKAKSETDIAKRIAAFQTLLKELKDRPERQELARLLQADEQTQRQKAEKEKTALAAKDLEKLQTLKDASNPAAAVLTLREYLEKNPDSPHRLEAKIIMDELLAAIEGKRKKERLWYIIGGALFVLTALSCLHISYFRYNLYSHNKTIPVGSHPTKADADQFTDPLSLNAQDSRSRVKRKTTRVPIPDEYAHEE